MSLEGKQRSQVRIGVTLLQTETPRFLLLPLSCGPFSKPWGSLCMLRRKRPLGARDFDGGAAGAPGLNRVPGNQAGPALLL